MKLLISFIMLAILGSYVMAANGTPDLRMQDSQAGAGFGISYDVAQRMKVNSAYFHRKGESTFYGGIDLGFRWRLPSHDTIRMGLAWSLLTYTANEDSMRMENWAFDLIRERHFYLTDNTALTVFLGGQINYLFDYITYPVNEKSYDFSNVRANFGIRYRWQTNGPTQLWAEVGQYSASIGGKYPGDEETYFRLGLTSVPMTFRFRTSIKIDPKSRSRLLNVGWESK